MSSPSPTIRSETPSPELGLTRANLPQTLDVVRLLFSTILPVIFNASRSSSPSINARPIERIFPALPEREHLYPIFNGHMKDYFPKEVKRRLSLVRTSDDLKHLTLEVRTECIRYNALVEDKIGLDPHDPHPYDYTNLATQWAVLEKLLKNPCLERKFELLEDLNAYGSFEGPVEVISHIRNQFQVVVTVMFGQFRFGSDWRTLPKKELLQALKEMSEIASKIMPSLRQLDHTDAIAKSTAAIEEGKFDSAIEYIISLRNLADKLQFIYSISRDQQKNIVSILSQPFGMTD